MIIWKCIVYVMIDIRVSLYIYIDNTFSLELFEYNMINNFKENV